MYSEKIKYTEISSSDISVLNIDRLIVCFPLALSLQSSFAIPNLMINK